jgi:hypothetical protein
MEDGNACRIELGTVGWERCWGAVTWTPVLQNFAENSVRIEGIEPSLGPARLNVPRRECEIACPTIEQGEVLFADRIWIVQNSCQSLALELFVSATHVQIERFKKSYS